MNTILYIYICYFFAVVFPLINLNMILQLFVQNIYLSVGIARFEIIKAKELNDEPHTGIHGDMVIIH